MGNLWRLWDAQGKLDRRELLVGRMRVMMRDDFEAYVRDQLVLDCRHPDIILGEVLLASEDD